MYLYGKNSVEERLKANPQSIKRIFLADNFTSAVIDKLIKTSRINTRRVSKRELNRLKHAENLGGIIAEVNEFEYADFFNLLSRVKQQPLSLIFLDRIFDPQNLGALMRIAACFGGFAVVIPKHKACPVTEAALHVCQGAENYLPVALVSNLSNALIAAKKEGYWALGAVTSGGQDLSKTQLPKPACLVLGSEGQGIRYGLNKHLDLSLTIPMRGAQLSFNVTAACAIFCYALSRRAVKANEKIINSGWR